MRYSVENEPDVVFDSDDAIKFWYSKKRIGYYVYSTLYYSSQCNYYLVKENIACKLTYKEAAKWLLMNNHSLHDAYNLIIST